MYFFEIRQIEEISKEYFYLIEDYFKGIYQSGVDKFFQAERIGNLEIAAQTILASIDELENDLTEFWDKNERRVIELTSNTDILKVIYCGSPSPLKGINFIKRTALYMDTLLIEDPISFLLKTKPVATDRAYLNQLIKHAFNLLDMKQLFFGEGEVPLLIIFPNMIRDKEKVNNIIENSGNEYFRLLFERDFLDADDVFDYLSKLDNVDQLLREVRNSEILFPDVADKKERLIDIYSDIHDSWKYKDFSFGSSLGFKIYGQFHNLGSQVFQAKELSSQIVFDRREYWNLFKWDISQKKNVNPNLDSTVLNTLQLDDFRWLEYMEIERLNHVRNEKELANIRGVIRKNMNLAVDGVSEEKVKEKAIENIEEALLEHSKRIDEFSSILKKKVPIDTLAVVAGTVASFPASWSLLPVIGAASTVYGIYDLIANTTKSVRNKKKVENSLMGVLFDAKRQDL